ncbi:MAG: LLM class flavin-dependent oxidoreductase [Alphaproteobacteria bacterium]|nr:LLM class flavin-dependent oxidoreductase [Alphaproteobacteria bacterium]
MPSIALSVLDQSPIRSGGTARQAIDETLALARLCDRLGYRRYWLAEHHNTNSFAGSAPEILIARVAQETQRLRVGSGGVMLTHYSPLKVAEQFRVLETLYPGRIDLGLGRAPGADPRTTTALQAGPQGFGIEAYPQQVQMLQAYLADACGEAPFGPEHPLARIHASPRGPGMPEIWLLGSGIHSAVYAAELGLGFSFAHFIAQEEGEPILEAYRQRFKPSAAFAIPRASFGVFALCAETAQEAARLALSRNLWVVRLLKGQHTPFPSPEEAAAHNFSEEERAILRAVEGRGIVGTPDHVHARIMEMAARYGAQEAIILTITHDFQARMRSYELMAAAFGLAAAA